MGVFWEQVGGYLFNMMGMFIEYMSWEWMEELVHYPCPLSASGLGTRTYFQILCMNLCNSRSAPRRPGIWV